MTKSSSELDMERKRFRPEIEGLRIVAALLVAVYHIWMQRVSGGVDVFFVVSGFLITASLLSKVRKDGTVNFFDFILGLAKRLFPAAFTVLFTVIIVSYFILPETQWMQTIKEVFASILYLENWQLAISNTDYLDQSNAKSPVQHFWAMSIQGQFYIIWFFIIMLALWISRKLRGEIKKTLFIILTALTVVSFGFSVYLTEVNQPFAYFDTRTRVWEFALGGLLFLFITKIKLPYWMSGMVGWFGLAALVSCGVLLDVGGQFPGYVALWPVLAAILILAAGENPTRFGVEKFLGSGPMRKLGGYSYGLYLWHWPIVAFYYVVMETRDIPVLHGILIILVSFGLSWIVTNVVEKPIRSIKGIKNYRPKVATVLVMMALPAVIANTAWVGSLQNNVAESTTDSAQDFPGAMAVENDIDITYDADTPLLPRPANLDGDVADTYEIGCHHEDGQKELPVCEYGDLEDPKYEVILVGGSHVVPWLGTLQTFAQEEEIKIYNITKISCRFNGEGVGEEMSPDCLEWNQMAKEKVIELDADLIIVNTDVGDGSVPEVEPERVDLYRELEKHDVEIFGIRNNPRPLFDMNICANPENVDHEDCVIPAEEYVPQPSKWSRVENKPGNVTEYDYSEYFCPDGSCPAIIGKTIVYFDGFHMSNSYAESMGPIVREDLMEKLESLER
ncbi:acyltransferase family protein [Salinicoccus halitifaciens]|uniref:Peptidoglycan/LPS O-acetylase OafA/YrhL n=1 Tax=Salinicoccus halitifaciens TaxID=1073415 RepID=A0ABV2E7W6_9STAP|nr:acyltransferase family protein [Salinicoccus halitifaciens]MCD2136424.1 acyltransferase [Salinicoccus halitifaciens]